jgi:hypothetical protein
MHSPNIITTEDIVLDYDFQFNGDFQLKPYQKATILKMLNHEENYNVKITMNDMYQNTLDDIIISKQEQSQFTTEMIYVNDMERKDDNTLYLNFHTNIGVLSNNVGSGKTAIVLGLIKYKRTIKQKYNKCCHIKKILYNTIQSFPRELTDLLSEFYDPNINCQLITHIDEKDIVNSLYFADIIKEKLINTNLIIIPHNLYQQWKDEIQKITNLKIKYINTKKDLNFTAEQLENGLFNKYDIILCNANKLKQLEKITNKFVWSRIFIDEVDTINIPNFPKLQSYFLWFISTTYERILKPKNKGFIYDLFSLDYRWRDDTQQIQKILLNSITYTCDKNYINKYLILETPEYNIKNYDSPFVNKVLYSLKHNKLNTHLYTNNYLDGIKCLFTKNSEFDYYFSYLVNYNRYPTQLYKYIMEQTHSYDKNIIFIALIYLNKNIYNQKVKIEHKERTYLEYKNNIKNNLNTWITVPEAKQAIRTIERNMITDTKKYYLLIQDLKYIYKMFKKNNICMYCHNCVLHLHKKLYCNNCYCTRTLKMEYTLQQAEYFKELDIYHDKLCSYYDTLGKLQELHTKTFRDIYKNEKIKIPIIKEVHNENTKLIELIDMIKEKKDKRILVFADNIDFFNKISVELTANDINYRILKGNNNVINSIIRKYQTKKIQVLLLNMKYMGSGLNLQCTDEIYITNYLDKNTEVQVIGRANRYGREGQLKVIYLFYEHENNLHKKNKEMKINDTMEINDED